MKLFLLGATGGTGLELVRQAPSRGHEVTAFGRAPGPLVPGPGLRLIAGSVLDPTALAAALPGHDVVLSALGPRTMKPTTLRTESTRALIEAMRKSGPNRLVVVSAALLFPDMGMLAAVLKVILRNGMKDAAAADALVGASQLDWTVVRPPRLTNGARKGQFRSATGTLPMGGSSIARADLAQFLLDLVEQHSHVREIVGVSY